jgi:hypothetical protein
MAARIGRFDPVIHHRLFADMQVLDDDLAFSVRAPAAAFIQRKFRIDQVALVIGQICAPLNAQLVSSPQVNASLSVRLFDAFFPRHHVDPDGVHRLHVGCAATIEIAAFLDQL